MESIRLKTFKNTPSIDEPIFSNGSIQISLRNIIVFGFCGLISVIMMKILVPRNFSITDDLVTSIIIVVPVIIGLAFVFIKTNMGTIDSIILSMFYVIRNNKKKSLKFEPEKQKKSKSLVLGFGKVVGSKKVSDEDEIQEILCADFDEIKTLNLRLFDINTGGELSNKTVKCYLDDLLLDTIKTTLDGDISVNITPKSEGKKKLEIKDNTDDSVLSTKLLLFRKK